MAESEAIPSVFTLVSIQAATATVMNIREANTGPMSGANIANLRSTQTKTLQTSSEANWNDPDKYVELLDFKMDVTNIL